MEKFKNTNGAISVFLVMILVPCMLVSSLFVDLGRVELSKEMAESSADLALNTLMTKYDADLKEYYGLIASCQDIDSFYEITAQYFLRTISSQGMSDEEIVLLSDYYSSVMNNDKIYDLLEVENIGTDSMIAPVENANLANASMIKEQVVEFMKYRAPIELLDNVGFLTKLKDLGGNLEDANEDNTLIEKKEAFYESENTINKQGYDIYVKLKEYQEKNITEEKLQTIVNNINSYEQKYKEIHEALVKDLYNTAGLGVIKRTSYDINSESYKISQYYNNSEDDYNLADENAVNSLIKAFAGKLTEFYKAKDEVGNAFTYYNAGTGESSTYDIQYWVNVSSGNVPGKLSALNTKLQEMIKAYNAVENAIAYMSDEAKEAFDDENAEKWKIEGEGNISYSGYNQELTTKEHYGKVQEQFMGASGVYSTYIQSPLKTDENNADSYIKYMSIIERISENSGYKNAINADIHAIPTGGQSVAASIASIYSQITSDRSALVEYRDILQAAIDLLKEFNVEEYHASFDSWNKIVEDSTTENGKEDRKDINEGSEKEEPVKDRVEKINEDDVANMLNRLLEIQKIYDNLIAKIDGLKYGTYAVKDISSFETAKTASGIKSSEIKLTYGELNNYVNSSFSYTKHNGTNATVSINNNNHPDMTHEPVPDLYKWMLDNSANWDKKEDDSCKNCGDTFNSGDYAAIIAEQGKEGSGEADSFDTGLCPKCAYEKMKEKQKSGEKFDDSETKSNAANDIKQTFFESEKDNFPSGFNKASMSAFSTLGGVVNIAKGLAGDFNGTVTKMRDSLYTTEYIFGMFTHSAYEGEQKYNMIKEKLQDNESALNLGGKDITKITSGEFEDICSNNDDVKKLWESKAETDTYNKSLTNKLTNKTNNFAYGGEIEYIMAGGDNDGNMKGIYGSIYAIRYLLNTPAAFATFWNPANAGSAPSTEVNVKIGVINAIATAVSTASCGIIPSALVKTGLILIETALETKIDIDYLKAGMPVKLVKSKNDRNWGYTRETEDNAGYFQYSDYLYIFILLGMNESEENATAVYTRIGDVIQANMRHIIGEKGKSYMLSNSITYLQLNATLRVKPLMITLPFFGEYDNDLDTKTDWCTYKIQTIRGY